MGAVEWMHVEAGLESKGGGGVRGIRWKQDYRADMEAGPGINM